MSLLLLFNQISGDIGDTLEDIHEVVLSSDTLKTQLTSDTLTVQITSDTPKITVE